MSGQNPLQAAIEFLENDEARNLLGLHRIRVEGELLTRSELAERLKSAQVLIQPKVTGYRQLSPVEAELMNRIKALGPQIEQVIKDVQAHNLEQRKASGRLAGDELIAEVDRLDAATPERFTALAKTDFQTALMYLVRAVAQPTTF